MNDWMIYAVGFVAQFIFASRIILQWLKSEKAKQLETPSAFWKLSLIAAIIFFIYGYLRKDFSIMLGQLIIYYVFIRNLQLQKEWKPTNILSKIVVIGFPLFAIFYGIFWANINFSLLFSQQEENGIATWLMAIGVIGQIIYTGRFLYQWYYSEQEKEYIQSVIKADFAEAGDEDVFRKLKLDLKDHNISEEEIRKKMDELNEKAKSEFK